MRCLINNSKTYGMLIVLVYSCFSCLIYAEEQTFTVDSALEGLSNSKNALDSHDLKIEYITQWRIYNTDGSRKEDSNIFDRVEAVYARKSSGPNQQCYLEKKLVRINADNGDITVISDGWASYDGNATYILDKNVREGKPKHGFIRVGFDVNHFQLNSVYKDPYTTIWNQGKTPLGAFIQQNKKEFQTEQGTDFLESTPSVKLAGNFADKKLKMKLWVSPQKNFLPLKRQIYNAQDGRLMSEMVLSNLVQLSNGMWFPKAIRDGSPDEEWAIHQEVVNISIDPIPEDFFAPEFPEGTQVVDKVLGLIYEK